MREIPDANKSDGQAGGTLAPAHVFRRLSQDCPDPMNQHSSQIELSNTVATTPRFCEAIGPLCLWGTLEIGRYSGSPPEIRRGNAAPRQRSRSGTGVV